MTTLNTKKVDESYTYDPFAEYRHTEETHQPDEVHIDIFPDPPKKVVQVIDPKEQLLKNIDQLFDGADFVFDIANKVLKRLGGR